MNIQQAIAELIERHDLDNGSMREVMQNIMRGEATPAQIGGFLIALRMKGETVEEIAACAQVMRELVTPVPVNGEHLVDTCGTGGDCANTFNISTACAFVVAAAGGQVAKHGNRSVSSSSGSADVLEAAGVCLELQPHEVAQCIERIGVGFMFAPQHHGAMKYAIGPRRELGVRTLFNLLGPLTNPAGAPNQVLGVYDRAWVEPLAEVLLKLGSRHVMVVHAEDGLDEISIASPTLVAEGRDGRVRCYDISPEDFGLQRQSLAGLSVHSAAASLALIRQVLDDTPGPARDIVCMNAGAAIYVAGVADSHAAGVARAAEVIASGAARERLQQLIELSNEF